MVELTKLRGVAQESGCELIVQGPDGEGMMVLKSCDDEITALDWSKEGF